MVWYRKRERNDLGQQLYGTLCVQQRAFFNGTGTGAILDYIYYELVCIVSTALVIIAM